ncbi:HipA N-terminal domain-containing protein [Shewanella subflava]|uniref:HipA N-terminal domain-containing protein n=1 Tax=Shewanella subflava TaxID=2986476 RepID=A0ABT3IC80_9GAMM|nr:HipA N-terminal domain-containing protein [Shewanella subflava]MCW3173498.1 HipA N-terminal domain-containing protein [Shewanella subflava]
MGLDIKKADAYRLYIKYVGQVIGNLSLDNTTNLFKLNYSPQWQNEGFAISPRLTLDNQHSPEVAYNFLDNALPEGEARKLLAENLGVSEKNVYSQVRAIGNDLAGAVTFLRSIGHLNRPVKRSFYLPKILNDL